MTRNSVLEYSFTPPRWHPKPAKSFKPSPANSVSKPSRNQNSWSTSLTMSSFQDILLWILRRRRSCWRGIDWRRRNCRGFRLRILWLDIMDFEGDRWSRLSGRARLRGDMLVIGYVCNIGRMATTKEGHWNVSFGGWNLGLHIAVSHKLYEYDATKTKRRAVLSWVSCAVSRRRYRKCYIGKQIFEVGIRT